MVDLSFQGRKSECGQGEIAPQFAVGVWVVCAAEFVTYDKGATFEEMAPFSQSLFATQNLKRSVQLKRRAFRLALRWTFRL
jgi:hypothetical protein